jgi:NAD+ synthase
MHPSPAVCTDLLKIDAAAETERIVEAVQETVFARFKRKGVVLGVSGGVDSSVVAALCARALGKERVFALIMPEADSSSDSAILGQELVEKLGIRSATETITGILESAGCYRRRDEAIREVFPDYNSECRAKIVLPNLLEQDRLPVFSIVAQWPDGTAKKARLKIEHYLQIVSATNFKQRVRKMLEYYYADRLNFAVAGTPNRLEHDLGFFVKNGDGSADLEPIAHLYKSQVYQLAAYLDIPMGIQLRPSTTDTYSLAQSQEEFYFSMPLATMDICLFGKDHGIPPSDLATRAGLSPEQVKRAYASIDSKKKASEYLLSPPVLMAPVS